VVANAQGLRSADRSVQVTNVGTGTLRIGQIDQTALAPPFLIFDDNCSGVALAPNASCSVVIRFQPTSQASFADSFDIPSDDADARLLTVNVGGGGQGLNVTINKVDTTGLPNVRIIVSVTDGDNNPVTGLTQSAFIISEGSVPKASNFFSNTVNTSVSAFLALDNSNSLGSTDITRSRNAAKLFVDLLAPGTDEAAVSKFARGVFLAADFTPIVAPPQTALNNAIDAVFPLPRDATFLFDAAYDAVDRLGTPGRKDRRAAIVLTDGNDFDLVDGVGSTRTADDVIANAQQKGAFIFTIGLGSKVNTEVLQEMAVSTGGQYFFAPTSADLSAIYQHLCSYPMR
jgi:VWFA-related protein